MRAVLSAVVLAAALLLAGPAAAAPTPAPAPAPAQPGILPGLPALPGLPGLPGVDCTSPPDVGVPDGGSAGELDPGPADPVAGDPFAPGDQPSAYEVYGWGGLTWPDYDLGCGPDEIRAPARSRTGDVARFMLASLSTATAFTAATTRFAFDPTTLDVIDPVVRAGSRVTGESIYARIGWITAGIAALLIVWTARSRRARLAQAGGNAAAIVLITGIVLATISLPMAGIRPVDNLVTGAVGAVNAAAAEAAGGDEPQAAEGIAANLHNGVVYSTWLSGNFGRRNSEAASEFGPRLYAASAMTRAEYQAVRDDPAAYAAKVAEKQAAYKALAGEIEQEHPEAYAYLEGNRNDDRIVYALIGWATYFTSAGFITLGAIVTLLGLFMLRLVSIAVPLLAIPAVLPGQRHHLLGPAYYLVGALWGGIRVSAVAALYAMLVGAVLRPDANLPVGLLIVLLVVFTWGAWKLADIKGAFGAITSTRYGKGLRKRAEDYVNDEIEFRPGHIANEAVVRRASAEQPFSATAPAPGATPAESRRAFVNDVVRSGITGAAVGAGAAAFTGGTSVAAGAAAGAGRAALGTVVGTGAVAAVDSAVSSTRLPNSPAPGGALPPGDGSSSTPAPAQAPPATAGPVPGDPPMRVYRPGEQTPAPTPEPTHPVVGDDGVPTYSIYRRAGSPS